MNKKLMIYLGCIFIALALIFFGIDAYLDYKFEKENLQWESDNQQLLQTALEKEDISYCDNYKFKIGCVVLVGQKLNDETVCEEAYDEEPIITACKASVLKDKSICAQNFQKSDLWYCESQYENIKSEIN